MKLLLIKLRWLLGKARPAAPFIILIILIGAVLSIFSIYRAIVLKYVIDSATTAQTQRMIKFSIILALILTSDIVLHAVSSILTTRSSTSILNYTQKKLFIHLNQSQWQQYSKYHSGDILTRITSDVEVITNVLVNTLPQIISMTVMLVGSFITLLFFDRMLAVLTLVLAPVTVCFSRIFAIKLKRLYSRIQGTESEYRSFLHETFQNMPVVKAFCMEKVNACKVEAIQAQKTQLIMTRSRVSALSNSVLSLGFWLSFFIVISWSSLNLSKAAISFGSLTALIQLFSNIQVPFTGLAYAFPQIIAALASTERLTNIESMSLDVMNEEAAISGAAGIQFDKVSFSYKNNEEILTDISLSVYPGEAIGLVGSSGEGKTTFIRLILALLYPQKGNIYIFNNRNKARVDASTRHSISYVPQGNTLFSGTIAENLRCGNPAATDMELEAAARKACAWDFISNFPKGLSTVIGERGLGISEGQAQRLAIARAILRKSAILILDEATSALDIDTEKKVLQEIRALKPVCTSIIITHRPSALDICDRVIRVENGLMEELGNAG